jgi:hypothetical protein
MPRNSKPTRLRKFSSVLVRFRFKFSHQNDSRAMHLEYFVNGTGAASAFYHLEEWKHLKFALYLLIKQSAFFTVASFHSQRPHWRHDADKHFKINQRSQRSGGNISCRTLESTNSTKTSLFIFSLYLLLLTYKVSS